MGRGKCRRVARRRRGIPPRHRGAVPLTTRRDRVPTEFGFVGPAPDGRPFFYGALRAAGGRHTTCRPRRGLPPPAPLGFASQRTPATARLRAGRGFAALRRDASVSG